MLVDGPLVVPVLDTVLSEELVLEMSDEAVDCALAAFSETV